jgi:hypothetical protein
MRSRLQRLREVLDFWSTRLYVSEWWWFLVIVAFLVLVGVAMATTADCRARGLAFYECGLGSP